MPKYYADNAMNRSLGRVGMEHGTAVHSRSSGDSFSASSYSDNNAYSERSRDTYVDHSSYRNIGSQSYSSTSNSNSRTYVDNAQNRSLGRVGLEHGTAVHHRGELNSSAMSSQPSSFADCLSRTMGIVEPERVQIVHRPNQSESGFGSSISSNSSKVYVDNAQNRSLGRVGLEHGTAVHHRGDSSSSALSSQPSGFADYISRTIGIVEPEHVQNTRGPTQSESGFGSRNSSSSAKVYVDNAQNRSLCRVGLEHGTAAHHKSDFGFGSRAPSNSSKAHVDNAQKRSLGRVGLEHGEAVHHKEESSSSSSKTYVDNKYNRSLGRVGLEHGAAVQHKDKSSQSDLSPKTYVDNAHNRRLNRVGLEKGLAKEKSNTSQRTDSSLASHLCTMTLKEPRVYKDNYLNQRLGRAGKPLGSKRYNPRPIAHTTYVDNSYNRRYNRVGKPLGSVPIPQEDRVYIDNTLNRQLGRVGLPWGICNGKPKAELMKRLRTLRSDEDVPDDVIEMYEDDRSAMDMIEAFLEIKDREAFVKNWLEEASHAYWEPHQHTAKKVIETYRGAVINCQELNIIQRIGHGNFGEVKLAEWKKGQLVAVKLLKNKNMSQSKVRDFEREILIICELDHENIVQFIGACVDPQHLAIVMEYMDISLHEALHIKSVDFREDERVSIMKDIANGLEYLHEKQMAHCDLKPANVLLNNIQGEETTNSNFPVIAKLTDFGLSLLKSESETAASSGGGGYVRNIGTPRYSAPEVLRGDRLCADQMMMADVYSFGLTVVELFLEEMPFEDLRLSQLIKHVGKRGMKPVMKNWQILTYDVRSWLDRCWDGKAEIRPESDAIASFARRCRKIFISDA